MAHGGPNLMAWFGDEWTAVEDKRLSKQNGWHRPYPYRPSERRERPPWRDVLYPLGRIVTVALVALTVCAWLWHWETTGLGLAAVAMAILSR